MKRNGPAPDDLPDGRGLSASPQTTSDLALVEASLHAAEILKAEAIAAMARIRARGDGEAAAGMPLEQYLRWATNQRGVVLTGMSTLVDVLPDLPVVRDALRSGQICLDQAIAIAWPAARVSRDVRRSLHLALSTEPSWTRWEADSVEWNVERLLAELEPSQAQEHERTAARRQYLHVQPELDGQAVKFWGRMEGLDAALLDTTLTAASPPPKAGTPRGPQRAAGLTRILRDWAHGRHHQTEPHDDTSLPLTIHLLVEEDHASEGVAAEIWTSIPGLTPRLTAAGLATAIGNGNATTTITSLTRNGVPVAIKGRAGHAIDDPDALSWDSRVELVKTRDARCRMPGCRNPITDIHHLKHRSNGGTDRLSNLAGLCRRCHHRIMHHHGWNGAVDHDGTLALRRNGRTITTLPRHRRRLRPPPTAPPDDAPAGTGHLDHDGDPIPF